MTPEQFTYWLNGFAELNQGAPTLEQWQSIKDHLKTVFHKVTPDYKLYPVPDYNRLGQLYQPNIPNTLKPIEFIC